MDRGESGNFDITHPSVGGRHDGPWGPIHGEDRKNQEEGEQLIGKNLPQHKMQRRKGPGTQVGMAPSGSPITRGEKGKERGARIDRREGKSTILRASILENRDM